MLSSSRLNHRSRGQRRTFTREGKALAEGVDLISDPVLIRIARTMNGTRAEGPDRRTAIWVQGCSIRCEGCINPQLFSPKGGELVTIEGIVADAVQSADEGITVLGGEPFDQPEPLAALCREAREAGLGVMCFSGYAREALEADPAMAEALQYIDLLVDGPYRHDDPETERALVGSTNQRFIHLTSRYEKYDPAATPNRVEIRVGVSGETEMAGFATHEQLTSWAGFTGTRRRLKLSVSSRQSPR